MTDADKYGIIVNRTGGRWQVDSIRHLLPSENRGGNHVYVNVFDKDGKRVGDPGLRVTWGWSGQRPGEIARPVLLDKPEEGEWGHGVVDMYWGQRTWVSIGSDSDVVSNIHTMHPDELGPNGELWNTRGHHSFVVTFRERQAATTPPSREEYEIIVRRKDGAIVFRKEFS